MHLLARDLHGLDDAGAAVDLEQTPGKIVFLSFSDSELGLLARVHDEDAASRPSLRCASLAQLKHPFSVDLYLDKVARHARLVVVRLLGGKEYWSYGVEQLAALSRAQGFALAIVPGDGLDDPRLREASTLAPRDCARIWSFFQDGGAENMRALLGLMASLIGMPAPWRESARIESAGYCRAARRTAGADARRALLVFYRSLFLSDDHAPILALADALAARKMAVEAVFVASLKDEASEAFLREAIRRVQTRRYREHDGLFGAERKRRRARSRRRAGVASGARHFDARSLGGVEARRQWRRSRDEHRAARGRRPHLHPRDFVQGAGRRASRQPVRANAPCAGIFAHRLRRGARRQLGRVAPQGEPRKKPRADFIGLPRAARTRRLRHRARYASERRGDCRGVERGGLRCRRNQSRRAI